MKGFIYWDARRSLPQSLVHVTMCKCRADPKAVQMMAYKELASREAITVYACMYM